MRPMQQRGRRACHRRGTHAETVRELRRPLSSIGTTEWVLLAGLLQREVTAAVNAAPVPLTGHEGSARPASQRRSVRGQRSARRGQGHST